MKQSGRNPFWTYKACTLAQMLDLDQRIPLIFSHAKPDSFAEYVEAVNDYFDSENHPALSLIAQSAAPRDRFEFKHTRMDGLSLVIALSCNRYLASKVRELSFSGCGLSVSEIEYVLLKLNEPDNAITALSFSYEQRLRSVPGLESVLSEDNKLESLSFYACKLGAEAAGRVLERLRGGHRTLKSIDFYDCCLGEENLRAVAEVLAAHHLLEFLGLGKNCIGKTAASAQALGEVLEQVCPRALTPAELEAHRRREREQLQVAERNKRARPEGRRPAPPLFLDPVIAEEGQSLLNRNSRLAMIDLSENNLTKSTYAHLKALHERQRMAKTIILLFNDPELPERVLNAATLPDEAAAAALRDLAAA